MHVSPHVRLASDVTPALCKLQDFVTDGSQVFAACSVWERLVKYNPLVNGVFLQATFTCPLAE